MHCRRFVDPGLTRRDMLLRCGNGFGALAAAALLRQPALRRPKRGGLSAETADRAVKFEPAGAAAAAFPGEGPQRHLPVHGRRAVAGRHVRSQAAPRPRARPADQGQDAPDAVQQRRQRARLPLEVPPVRRERHPGQRPVPARRPVRRRPGDRPLDGLELLRAHQRQLLHAHRQRAAGPAQPWARGSPTAWAASARTCRASWSRTAA